MSQFLKQDAADDYLMGSLNLATIDTRGGRNQDEITRVGILAGQAGQSENFNKYVGKITATGLTAGETASASGSSTTKPKGLFG